MRLRPLNDSGVAMTVAMIVIVILTLLAGFSMNFGYNRKRLIDVSSGKRDVINYRAQAGLVDANTRIRKNITEGLTPSGSFTDPAYDPQPYQIDVDGNGSFSNNRTKICSANCDVTIDIGPQVNGARNIISTGLE